MVSSTGSLPQEEENLVTLYDVKTTTPLGRFSYQGDFPSHPRLAADLNSPPLLSCPHLSLLVLRDT